MSNELKATVFIPVYNGEHDHLEETLRALYRQETDFSWDLLITDSGSTDASVSIIKRFASQYGNLRLIHLNKEEYSHGGTRQMAAEIARGEYMVYLSQDAVPYQTNWLQEMLEPFTINNRIVAVLGRQKPRNYCFPAMKYDINAVFDEQGSRDAITLWKRTQTDQIGQYSKESFYSDVCSAAPRQFLVDVIGYRSVAYSEDYEFGKDIIDAGYWKAYNGRAVVEHSNDVRLSEYQKRIFDEAYNVRVNSGVTNSVSFLTLLHQALRSSVKDTLRILSDSDYGWKRKLYWLAINPLFHLEKWRGIRLANQVNMNEDITKFSLEKSK